MSKIQFKNKWHAAGVVGLVVTAAIGVGAYLSGGFDTGPAPISNNSVPEQPAVVPPPESVQVESITVNGKKIEYDNEMLELARKLKIQTMQAKLNELEKPKESSISLNQQMPLAAPPMNFPGQIPANPLTGEPSKSGGTSGASLHVKMIVHGVDPVAYIERDGEQIPVHIGDKAFGKTVSAIRENEVCFKGSDCLALSL